MLAQKEPRKIKYGPVVIEKSRLESSQMNRAKQDRVKGYRDAERQSSEAKDGVPPQSAERGASQGQVNAVTVQV